MGWSVRVFDLTRPGGVLLCKCPVPGIGQRGESGCLVLPLDEMTKQCTGHQIYTAIESVHYPPLPPDFDTSTTSPSRVVVCMWPRVSVLTRYLPRYLVVKPRAPQWPDFFDLDKVLGTFWYTQGAVLQEMVINF